MNTSFWLLSIGVSLDFESAWDCCMPRCYMLPMYFVINGKMSFHTLITLTLLWCFLPSINYLLIWTTVDSQSYTWFKTVYLFFCSVTIMLVTQLMTKNLKCLVLCWEFDLLVNSIELNMLDLYFISPPMKAYPYGIIQSWIHSSCEVSIYV